MEEIIDVAKVVLFFQQHRTIAIFAGLLLWSVVIIIIMRRDSLIKLGKLEIGFGKKKEHPAKQNKKNMTCGDCLLVTSSWFMEGRITAIRIYDRILRDQLQYADQMTTNIIQIIQAFFVSNQSAKPESHYNGLYSRSFEMQQFVGIIRGYENILMGELRRAIKENGFHKFEIDQFNHYVKSLSDNINAKTEQFLMAEYPNAHMIVKFSDFFFANSTQIKEYIFKSVKDSIETSKRIRTEGDDELKKIDAETKERINKFIGYQAF